MISVIIPTLNEEQRIGNVVKFCFQSPLISEVIVIDDGSTDATVKEAYEAGALVHFSSMLGKGTSMHDGLLKAKCDFILYLDGDIYNFSENLIELMVQPLLADQCDFVKGRFHRKSGRVTELTAKPLLKVFFPEISTIEQPLGGIVASKKRLLMDLQFESDYAVDIGLLIDVAQLGLRIVEVDIGSLDHDHQPLDKLGHMSAQIVKAILNRAFLLNRLNMMQLHNSYEALRVSQLQVSPIMKKIDPTKKLALFDMDGTLLEGRYIDYLIKHVGRENQFKDLIDNRKLPPISRTQMIAKALTGIPKSVFEKIAEAVPLAENAQKIVVELKKRGFTVGIITDSYFIASEIIRKRVFADFSIAHMLDFKNGVVSGELTISPLMLSGMCQKHDVCKVNFLGHMNKVIDLDRSNIYFAGDGINDVCLLESISNSAAVKPKHILVIKAATYVVDDLAKLLYRWK